MHSTITQSVAATVAEDRLRAARGRAAVAGRHRARPPGAVRRQAASAAARVARRLDAESARSTIAI